MSRLVSVSRRTSCESVPDTAYGMKTTALKSTKDFSNVDIYSMHSSSNKACIVQLTFPKGIVFGKVGVWRLDPTFFILMIKRLIYIGWQLYFGTATLSGLKYFASYVYCLPTHVFFGPTQEEVA